MLLSPSLVAGAPVAQLDRASASGAEGHRFKSCQAHQQTGKGQGRTQISATHIPGGPLAQLVEQLTLNQRAVGSTPTRPTTNQPLTASTPLPPELLALGRNVRQPPGDPRTDCPAPSPTGSLANRDFYVLT